MLSQPQFFAVLRLLAHAHANASGSAPATTNSNKDLDPIFVFIQPPDSSSSAIASPSLSIGSSSAATTPGVGTRNSNNPFNARGNASTPAKNSPNPPPNNNTTTTTTGRPFSNSISNSASALSSDEGSVPDFVHSGGYGQVHGRASSSPAPSAPNPFLARTNSIPQSAVGAGVGVGPIAQETKPSTGVVVPPALPPRKPNFLPPPRHASQQGHANGSIGSTSTIPPPMHSKEPPLKPPKPPMHSAPPVPVPAAVTLAPTTQSPVVVPGHVTSPLIKQGLLAAKGAQRSAEQGLEKLRTWEVIKSSSNASAPNGGAGAHRERERGGSISSGGGSQQRAPSGERGPSGTIRIQSTTRHARGTSIAGGSGVGSYEPPAQMDRDEEGPFVTPTSTGVLSPILSVGPSSPLPYRVARSRSLHASSSPTANVDASESHASSSISPPVPPPRRKRPESVQIGWRRAGEEEEAGPFGDRSRTATINHDGEYGASNPIASIRRQFHHLQAKTQPGLESARAKVEGKLMPGGYGKWGSESLTGGGGNIGVLRRKASVGTGGSPNPHANANATRTPLGGSSEGSDEFEDADEVLSTDDDVRKNGWKPLKG